MVTFKIIYIPLAVIKDIAEYRFTGGGGKKKKKVRKISTSLYKQCEHDRTSSLKTKSLVYLLRISRQALFCSYVGVKLCF